jgi:1-acyl-sn-glycerol-3-phosphate acyltransferase
MANVTTVRRVDLPAAGEEPRIRRWLKAVVHSYMRIWHDIDLGGEGLPHVPTSGPLLVLVNHASALDVPALIAVDPYPDSVAIVKDSLYKVWPIRPFLHAWGAIPVSRDGRDAAAIRAIFSALRRGRVVAVAAEGTRSRTGRLQPVNPVLARIAVRSCAPILPVAIIGSFDALPPGTLLPRRRKISIRVGESFRLPSGTSDVEAAERIHDAIAAMLPPGQQPLPDRQT